MGSPSVGTVVILPFPFSDLSQSKLRPAIVLADAKRDDWVLCQITSKSYADPNAIKLEESDFETGSLSLTSYVRPSKLFTANSSLMESHAGVLKRACLEKVLEAVTAFLSVPKNYDGLSAFTIRSVNSDLTLVFSDLNGEYFEIHVVSHDISVQRKVWAYRDAMTLVDMLERLAAQPGPWQGSEEWTSLECEFMFSATCNNLGHVTFEVEIFGSHSPEEWSIKTALMSEFGQLPHIARMARKFFGQSSA